MTLLLRLVEGGLCFGNFLYIEEALESEVC